MILKCLKQAKFKQYLGHFDILPSKTEGTQKVLIQLAFDFASDKRTIHEEIYIFDEIGLPSSIGGSLGLFIGFSFFSYISEIMDLVVKQILKSSF